MFAERGRINNPEKCKSIGDGIFEMKSYQWRIPFFYHPVVKTHIVITHMFQKKQNIWPKEELRRALERKAVGEKLRPEHEE